MDGCLYRVGIDVGGTFTDIMVMRDGAAGEPAFHDKTPSIPGNEAAAVIDALELAATHHGLALEAFLGATDTINFGTTVVTNAMLEHKGAAAAMITTRGFRDVIDLRRGYKESLFDIRLAAPPPIVRRRHRIGVTERIDCDGKVVVPLDEEEVIAAVKQLRAAGIAAYSVCLLQSPANPVHEQRVAGLIREHHPGAFVTISSEVLKQVGEFERFSTTAVNAYVGPVLDGYMRQLVERLRAHGFSGRVRVMQSNGGSVPPEFAGRHAVGALLSGPAAGVIAAAEVGRAAGFPDVIGVDMGGTSYDVSLVRNAVPEVGTDAWVARYRIAVPMLDIHTIGAGGGSVAWIDGGGALRVGPESAGARPGPACYGRGGERATVTDANLVLGYIGADHFMGGRMRLERARAEAAILASVGRPLGLDLDEAAVGIARIVNNNMANGIRYVSVARGHDPCDFALLAFGGAAAIHAPVQARDLGIRTILVPKSAAVLCALGELMADLKVTALLPFVRGVADVDPAQVSREFAAMAERDAPTVTASDVVRIEQRCYAALRYRGQVRELITPIAHRSGVIGAAEWNAAVAEFHDLHRRLYTFSLPDRPVDVISLRHEMIGVRRKVLPTPGVATAARSAPPPKGWRRMCVPQADGGARFPEVPVFAGERLEPGHGVEGPAIIEEAHTSVVLFPGDRCTLRHDGTYVISVGTGEDA